MKPIHIKRLRKLIAFLRKLPRKRFNFSIVRNEPPKCGAVGCAIGYMPNVFPSVIRSFPLARYEEDRWTHTVGFRGNNYGSFTDVAIWVSGLDYGDANALFEPGRQKEVNSRLANLPEDATPKQVARMLEKFIKLQTEK